MPGTHQGCRCKCGPHGFLRAASRRASSRDFRFGFDVSGKGRSPASLSQPARIQLKKILARRSLNVDGHADLVEPALPIHISRNFKQQGLDRLLAHTAFRCAFFRARSCSMAAASQASRWGSGAGPQLWIPASQLLELDARVFSPHLGKVSPAPWKRRLRDAIWTGVSQSRALA